MSSQKFTVIKKISRWLIPLLISVLAFWLVFRNIDLSKFVSNLKRVGFEALLYATLLHFLSLFFRVFSWYILLGRKVSFKDAFFTMNAGYLLNNVFPFRLGEVGRALLLDTPEGPSALEAFSSVIVERVFDVFLAAVFVLIMLPRVLAGDAQQTIIYIAFSVAVLGILALYLIARYRKKILVWLERWGKKAAFIDRWVKPKAAQILEGLSVLSNPRLFLLAFGSLFISWMLAFVQNFVVFRTLYPNPPFWWMIFVLSIGTFGIALPSGPAGLGVFEGAMVAGFALLGVDAELGFAHAIIIHAVSIVYNNIFGLIGLHLRGEALVDLYQRAIRRSPKVQPQE
ncbi:MAG: hypothetical protein XE06_1128 [Anaerolineaceae bacterium 46_22]|nr:MAG: hypothetical protein XE06_1128 [Anaerolineaceae bacterium 46_22]